MMNGDFVVHSNEASPGVEGSGIASGWHISDWAWPLRGYFKSSANRNRRSSLDAKKLKMTIRARDYLPSHLLGDCGQSTQSQCLGINDNSNGAQ